MSLLMHKILAGESLNHHLDIEYIDECVNIIKSAKSEDASKTALKLSKAISKGIRGVIEVRIVDGQGVACILPPDLTFRHPLINTFRNHDLAGKDGLALLQETEKVIGEFNPVTGKLSGMLSKLVGVINISPDMIGGKLLDFIEGIAIIGHEVGHHLGYCQAVGTLVRGNVAVSYATKQVLGEEKRTTRIAAIKTATRLTGGEVEPQDILAAADSDNEEIIAGVVSVTAATQFRSKFGSSMYDRQAYEQLADQYSARMGLSVPFGTGLIKIHKAFGSYEMMSSPAFIALEVFKIAIILLGVFSNPFTIISYYFLSKYKHTMHSEYPTLTGRIDNLINDANSSLAMPGLTKEQRARVLSNISELKNTRNLVKRDQGPISAVYNWVHTSKDDRNITKQLMAIENLTNNDLFASAARLNTK